MTRTWDYSWLLYQTAVSKYSNQLLNLIDWDCPELSCFKVKQVEEKGEKWTAHEDPANPVREWARNVSQASGESWGIQGLWQVTVDKGNAMWNRSFASKALRLLSWIYARFHCSACSNVDYVWRFMDPLWIPTDCFAGLGSGWPCKGAPAYSIIL